MVKTKTDEQPPPSQQEKAAPLQRLRAPKGTGAAGGPSGKSYKVGQDRTVRVDPEDVAALINLGFKPAE